MRTHRRKFMPQFHEAVRTGRKLQTVRPWPKVVPQPGDEFIAEAWAGKPYRSKVVELARGIISKPCQEVEITATGDIFLDREMQFFPENAEAFAKADGFESYAGMMVWFLKHHGLPFLDGCLIQWEPKPEDVKP